MSGLSYDDPFVIDTSAASGSVAINSTGAGAAKRYYLKLTGIPQDRLTYPSVTEGTGHLETNSNAWRAYSAAYAEERAGLGSYFGPGSNFMASGRDVIVILTFTTLGTITWAWTSKDAAPHRPYSWIEADPLTPPGNGSIGYDGLGGGIPDLDYFTERFYWIEPTTDDPITVSSNEPDGYFEVYHETTDRPFDEYIEYGQNLSDGTPDHVLQFTPIPGERYVVYLTTTGVPSKATTYQLSWSSSSLTPPPYVVPNDNIADAQLVTLATDTGSFDYDNTGATEDPTYGGKRSIWYRFTLPTRRVVRLSPTPGESSPGNVPSLWLGEMDDGIVSYAGQVGGDDGEPMTFTAQAGVEYHLQVYFDAAVLTDPWDDGGSIAWQLADLPVNSDISHAIPLSVGAGQNTAVVGAVPGYTGDGLFYKITIPRDGGLNVALETATPATDQYVRIFKDGVEIASIQSRATGATTPRAWVHKVVAGEVYIAQVVVTVTDAVLRWGVSQPTWSDWMSTDQGAIMGVGGIPLYVRDWGPQGINNGTSGFQSLAIRIHSDHTIEQQVPDAIIDTLNAERALAIVSQGAGDRADFYIDEAGSYKGPSEEWHGYSAWGLENRPPPEGQITKTVNNGEFSNTRWAHTFTVETVDLDNNWSNYQPIIQDAFYKWANDIPHPIGDAIPAGASYPYFVIEDILDNYAIEYNTPDGSVGRPKFNLYRAPPQITWRKQINTVGVWGSMYEGHYAGPESFETRLYEIPWSFMENDGSLLKAWNFFPEKMMPYPVMFSFDVPTNGPDEFKEPDGRDTHFGATYGEDPYGGFTGLHTDYIIEEDVFPNLRVGDTIHKAYGLWTTIWFTKGATIGVADMHPTFKMRWGYPASAVSLDTWPFWWYRIQYYMAHTVAREYPSEYRVGSFLEDFSELAPAAPDLLPSTSVADAGEYSYMGDVGVGTAPPVLWFVYQKWGFLGQSFVAYGHGLGDSIGQLNGRLYLGEGPPETYPVPGEFRPPIEEWALYPAGPNAYDGSQVQFPGTSVAPPKVDTEHQIIEFLVPNSLTLTAPTEYHLYVVNDHGTSNALSLLLYPMIDIDMEAADPLLNTVTGAMGVFDTPETFEGPTLFDASPLLSVLPQNYSKISAPWVLTGRVPERAPAFLTQAKAAFALTGGAPATGLDDPVTVALPVPLRFRPLDSRVASRPDLGTGMSAWNSNESSSMDFKFHYLSAPYVDAENVVASRNGNIVRPAMAFPGNAWAESTASFPTGPKMVFAMAVTIFPDPQARSYLLSSFISGAVDPDSFPLGLYVEGDQLSLVIGTKVQTSRIAPGYIGRRPIIIALTLNDTALTYVVASDKATMRTLTHPKLTASGLRLYLGRNNDAGSMQMASMDILDMGIDHTAAATVTRLWSIVNRLDGIYGVMK